MNAYTRLTTLSIDEVVPHVVMNSKSRSRVIIENYSVGVTSMRLKTFARDYHVGKLCCISCGLQAKFFAIEYGTYNPQTKDKPHLNLYGILNGEEILFTHDHTLARCLGGRDHLDNIATMCGPCNAAKSIDEQTLLKQKTS